MADPNLSFFARWASFYSKTPLLGPVLRSQQDGAIERLNPAIGERILDLGCGPGRGLGVLARHGAQAVGVDQSPEMLIGAGSFAPVARGTAFALPFKDASFDAILCTNSFHHYAEPLATLREMRRVLKPGGRVALVDPNLTHPLARLIIYGGEALVFGMGVHLHSASDFRAMFHDAGFSRSYVEPLVPPLARWLMELPSVKQKIESIPILGRLSDPLAVSLCAVAWA